MTDTRTRARLSLLIVMLLSRSLPAGVGDPQLGTDHPWYPGELACSSFERLRATQAQVFTRVTGRAPASDEVRAIASWLWRNTHYAHGEPGAEDRTGACRLRIADSILRAACGGTVA